ncbi:hypothetical protein KQI46_08865 [Lysinibacillus capsici]|uniref:hypothetical protein n=1 Tax=Lysinibacillus capsici TaxID=2115968 RepID=UPI001C1236F6|nr:hypothetical protein [Lysinibacillus capsici]MBU5252050.1 hypothetical protein [Lysinibacillus capsici]
MNEGEKMGYEFEVIITFYENTIESNKKYNFTANDYPSFRTEFLKRFGNLTTTNKKMKQKEIVKKLSYIAESTKQFVGFVNVNTDFNIKFTAKEVRT